MSFRQCNTPSMFKGRGTCPPGITVVKMLLIYLYDVIITGKNLKSISFICEKLAHGSREHVIKLEATKCQICQTIFLFLGHMHVQYQRSGYQFWSCLRYAKLECWTEPKRAKRVKTFLCLTNYYRKFVHSYANIALPLHQIDMEMFIWERDIAFEEEFKGSTTVPGLAYPLAYGMLILDTEDLNSSIGATLSQLQNAAEKPISYTSQPSRKTVLSLAVVAFCQHFKYYLLGKNVLIRTDHCSLWLFAQLKYPQDQLAILLNTTSCEC